MAENLPPTDVRLRDLADPTDLDALRDAIRAQDPAGVLVPLELRDLVVSEHAADEVASTLRKLLGEKLTGATVVLLVDDTPIRRGQVLLKDHVQDLVRAAVDDGRGGGRCERVVLRGDHPLHADDAALDEATEAVRGSDAVVTVGGGTITDIGKVATARTGGQPLVVVQTAASVDGFTDNVSVVLASGVKKTIPSRWPDVVLADLETIAGAPPQMAAAGYGELLSMFTAPADWYLAKLLGIDPTFHEVPVELLAVVGRGLDAWSPGVVRAEPDAIAALTRALDVRGIATGVSGGTAVLSGVEHLVSHMLDMHHGARHEPIGLHGAQVGVASVVAATAWDVLFEHLATGGGRDLDVEALRPDPASAEERCRAAFGHLDEDGALAAECARRYGQKLQALAQAAPAVAGLLREPQEHVEVLRGLLTPAADLLAGLHAAGVTASFAELEPSVPEELARWAVGNCHLMRERLTVVDLLDLLGLWTPAVVDRVLGALDAPRAAAATP
ncbi:iron-containing alcohol dehydrogenase [Kineococcus gynurae]|uniref:Iron-containing alcohol dehydrogenase n=1 Tax=Kineococcus gynurae TaxID=452979 RepID=A0ABV5LP99_9ACTN